MERYQSLIEKILGYFAVPEFRDEVQKAKGEFFDNAGILEENSDHFELRMNQFFDWYFFARPLSGYAQTPLNSCYTVRALRFSEEEKTRLEELKRHRHSLFVYLRAEGNDLVIRDLLKGDKITIKNSPWLIGFNSDEAFDARLVPNEDGWIFTKGFCFHPNAAMKYIQSEVKRHLKNPDLDQEEMMLRLIKMRYAFERYRHLKPEAIYSSESKVVF